MASIVASPVASGSASGDRLKEGHLPPSSTLPPKKFKIYNDIQDKFKGSKQSKVIGSMMIGSVRRLPRSTTKIWNAATRNKSKNLGYGQEVLWSSTLGWWLAFDYSPLLVLSSAFKMMCALVATYLMFYGISVYALYYFNAAIPKDGDGKLIELPCGKEVL